MQCEAGRDERLRRTAPHTGRCEERNELSTSKHPAAQRRVAKSRSLESESGVEPPHSKVVFRTAKDDQGMPPSKKKPPEGGFD
jgi:hypothetical protein